MKIGTYLQEIIKLYFGILPVHIATIFSALFLQGWYIEPMHMLHHISFPVNDIKKSTEFYTAVLAPLGYRCVFKSEKFVGYGVEKNKDKFALVQKDEGTIAPGNGFHLAFSANSLADVDNFFKLAIKNGGKSNGEPGPRPDYGPNYYATFIIDPDGYHIEAVINTPPES